MGEIAITQVSGQRANFLRAFEEGLVVAKNLPSKSAGESIPGNIAGIDLEVALCEVISRSSRAANFGTGEGNGRGVGGDERVVVNSFRRHDLLLWAENVLGKCSGRNCGEEI